MKLGLILCFSLLAGCSTTKTAQKADTYLDNVKLAYEAGEKALKNQDYRAMEEQNGHLRSN